MTSAAVTRSGGVRGGLSKLRNLRSARADRGPLPPLSPRLQLARAILLMLLVLSGSMFLQYFFVSGLQQRSAQVQHYDLFRDQLAEGTAPIGPTSNSGDPVQLGDPIAQLEIPTIDVEQVVLEGTTAGVLLDGPGHRRDTVLPGQVGTSVLYGRRTSYGGPFGSLDKLKLNDLIRVTTGQGVFEYRVIGLRVEGSPLPAPVAAGGSRIVLTTAGGSTLFPNGVLRVDAEIDGTPVVGAARSISSSALPANEQLMKGDTRTLWALALWLQVLIALSVGFLWAWNRWGRAPAWVVCLPPLILVGLAAAGEALRLIPNLM